MSDFQHGDRVRLTGNVISSVAVGDTGTVTHLNGDGELGTPSSWTSTNGDRVVWVEWDTPDGEMPRAYWALKSELSKEV